MKKICVVILAGILNLGLFSCNPHDESDEIPGIEDTQGCCDDDEIILPPPPPPPPGNGNN
ncbi:hypothetical protein SAMN02927921_03066 [Sinomicrobium oceani]|uniref:Uncharacterized protein n=1 Tax=Sinomicrobium oceani TaxID=1150368 RepID=A0A1K1R0J6_9FLAO|nr:hypothetical protein [Sinomicrobium oceani]SFW65656.1 hypothetical protein SAMN02927921_03066 [Sinomicrobium oceani]